jgi:DNA polymerase III subunit epsilon
MLREIVLDTETTGTDHAKGDRVIEIGCVELLNHIPTGKSYHVYINPECPVSPGAFAVHGLSDEFLKDKPVFAAIADEFAEFVRDARLVIHNAAFDIGFLNAEFARTGHTRFNLPDAVDTLTRYGIDNSRRTKHGALLDAEILAEVYIELIGGRQVGFDLSLRPAARGRAAAQGQIAAQDARPRTLISRLTEAERAAHEAFIQSLGPNTLWREYLGETTPEAS